MDMDGHGWTWMDMVTWCDCYEWVCVYVCMQVGSSRSGSRQGGENELCTQLISAVLISVISVIVSTVINSEAVEDVESKISKISKSRPSRVVVSSCRRVLRHVVIHAKDILATHGNAECPEGCRMLVTRMSIFVNFHRQILPSCLVLGMNVMHQKACRAASPMRSFCVSVNPKATEFPNGTPMGHQRQ